MFAKRTNWNLTTNRYTQTLERLRGEGRKLLDLTVSNPTEAGLGYDTAAVLAALGHPEVMQYQPSAMGLLAARQAVAGYYAKKEPSLAIRAEQIILTTSTSEAYTWLLRLLCEAGDEILVAQPSYPLVEFLADLCDVKIVRYPLLYDHGWLIDLHALEAACTERTRAVLVGNPNNPTGNFVSSEERKALQQLCSKRGMALIADEVFLDFALGTEPGASLAGENEALTFVLSGISKVCGLPQMKLGWMIVGGPEAAYKQAMERLEVIADTYLSPAAPQQAA